MKRVTEYLEHSAMCRSMAHLANDPGRKEELLELAAKWALLAEEREKLLASQQRLMKLP